MSEKSIMVDPLVHRPPGTSPHVKTLATMLEIARIDQVGERIGSRERRKLVMGLPASLGATKIDDYMEDDFTAPRYQARQLLLTDAIESTSLLNEEVVRTVMAGGDKVKVVRSMGCSMYNTTSNSLRVPIGEAQINASVVAEAAEIPDRTQNYDFRTLTIQKYGVKPRISFEMVEDGLVDVVAEEIFWAGASLENKLNIDALTNLQTNATNTTVNDAANQSSTAGNAYGVIRQGRGLMRADGFTPDTLVMCTAFEADLLASSNLVQAQMYGSPTLIRSGIIPKFLGLNAFTTDNGHATAARWAYGADAETGALLIEAKRALGIAVRRDITVKKFDDISRELHTITATLRSAVSYLHANATCILNYQVT